MAIATSVLAAEAKQQRLAPNDLLISVYASFVWENAVVVLSRSNVGPGSAYQVEPLIIVARSVQEVRADWAKGDYSCGPSKLTRAPWAVLSAGQSIDYQWGITHALGREFVAVALYKDRLGRPWASAYGFRMEEGGLDSTGAIPPHLQGDLLKGGA